MNSLSFRSHGLGSLSERPVLKLGVSGIVLCLVVAQLSAGLAVLDDSVTILLGVSVLALVWYAVGTDRVAETDRLAALFENSTDSIVRVDLRDMSILAVNGRFEASFGYDEETIRGESIVDLIVPEACRDEAEEMVRQAREGEEFTREIRRETATGTQAFLFRFVPITTGESATEGYGVYTDITAHKRTQRTLETSNRALRRLHEITTDRDREFEATVQGLLELGCDQFDLDVGILSRIEGDEYTVVEAVDGAGEVTAGDEFPLQQTICEITVSGDPSDVVTLPDIGESTYSEHPAYRAGFPEAYIGTTVVVDGEIYGTVNVSSRSAREPFCESERELVKLLAQWIGRELERANRLTDLARSRDLLQQAQRLADVGAWELDTESETIHTTRDVSGLVERPLESPLDLDRAIALHHPEDQPRVRDAIDRARAGEPFDLEARLTTEAGTERWVRAIGEPVETDGEITRVRGAVQDITERKRDERELELAETAFENTQDALFVNTVDEDADEFLMERINPVFEEQTGLTNESVRGRDLRDIFGAEEGAAMVRNNRECIARREPIEYEEEVTVSDAGRYWETRMAPVIIDGEVEGIVGATRNITARKEREQALESLHDATRQLLHTESTADICEVVVEIAADVLDVAGISVALLDAEASEFVPTAFSPGFVDRCDPAPTFPVGDDESPVWRAFVTDETVTETARLPRDWDSTVRSGLFVPVGDHGVFVALSTDEGIDDRTRQLAETLVATAEAAVDRLEHEADLREHEHRLEAQNARLTRQIQVTDIIRAVDQSLIEATTREEIQTAVCERLVDSDVVSFAWIGDPTEETLVPQAWAGEGHRYLDEVSLTDDEPAVTTARTGETTVVESVLDRLRSAPWRTVALTYDFQSVISVPVVHDEYTYGVVTAYAAQANAFGDLERSIFRELGERVGHAINVVQTRQALYGDTATELTLRFRDEESLLLTLAAEIDCRVELDGISTDDAGTARLFFSVAGTDPEAVAARLDDLVAVTDARLITETDDGGQFEATVSEGLIAATLLPQGVRPHSVVAENGRMDVVIDLPPGTDVREFLELLADRYPSVELVGRRDVDRDTGTKSELAASLLDGLTDRQREILLTAYYSGFFEWPRESTGQEVAAMLDVSQPTVNRHLRHAERALLAGLLADHTPSIPA